jgi:hypothetical protein
MLAYSPVTASSFEASEKGGRASNESSSQLVAKCRSLLTFYEGIGSIEPRLLFIHYL